MLKATVLAVFAIILSAAMMVLAQSFPPAPQVLTWLPQFPAPGLMTPQIVLSMAAADENNLYLGGMSNGQPGGIFHWDGKYGGQVAKMPDMNMSLIPMAVAIGKSASGQVTGAYSSIEMLSESKALQYLKGGATGTWEASAMPWEFIFAAESISGNKEGSHYVAVGDGPISGNAFMVSTDGGRSFSAQKINFTPPQGRMTNCSFPNMITVVSPSVWYLSWGAEPPQNNPNSGSGSRGSSSSFSGQAAGLTAGVDAKYLQADEIIVARPKKHAGQNLIIKNTKTGAIRQHFKTPAETYADRKEAQKAAAGQCDFFAGYVLKSVDGGRSWKNVFTTETENTGLISCYDENNCAMVGFNGDVSSTYVMVNGGAWQKTKTTPPASKTEAETIGAIAYAGSASDVWAAGSMQSQSGGRALFWSSTNGGSTWTEFKDSVPTVMAILDMEFVGKVGFASGLTQFKTTEILKYALQADYGTFTQKNCELPKCALCLQVNTFSMGKCLIAQGGSANVLCVDRNGKKEVLQRMYETTSCVGSFKDSFQPVNTCLNSTRGTYFENECSKFYPFPAALDMLSGEAAKNEKLFIAH